MIRVYLDIVVLAGCDALAGMMLADLIHKWQTGKRIRDCGEQKE